MVVNFYQDCKDNILQLWKEKRTDGESNGNEHLFMFLVFVTPLMLFLKKEEAYELKETVDDI